MAERPARTLAPPDPRLQYDPTTNRTSSRSRSRSPDVLSLLSNDELPELRTPSRPQTPLPTNQASSSSSPQIHSKPKPRPVKIEQDNSNVAAESSTTKKKSTRVRLWEIWDGNYGLMLVFLAQLFATLMNVTTGLLESQGEGGGGGMHPFQILFARMSITVVCSLIYMWCKSTPDWPLGARDVRWLLVLRGVGGFFGVFGLYWSLQYLPLSDATVITFLAPTLACYACSKFINEPFTRTELIGGIVSLAGVVLIARPTYLFNSAPSDDVPSPTDAANPTAPATAVAAAASGVEPTPGQHLAAIGMAIVGVFGAASAYTTIRIIGHRAHPLISVTYFAFWCTLVSFVALTFVPSIPFILPSTIYQWTLLFFIGISGFCMQFLLTAGLRAEKSGRATNMVYTQMIFALLAEKVIWGTTPGMWSWAGSLLIMGAAGAVAMQKSAGTTSKSSAQTANVAAASGSASAARDEEEATGMLMHDADIHRLDDDDDDQDDIEMEVQEKRGHGFSIEEDEETLRPSLDHDGPPDVEGLEKEISRSLDPEGNWKFSQTQRKRVGKKTYSEEVSPHSPVMSRKGAVFWSK